ncbi:hypothetical protein PV10_01953 [Exophiala mesophila]|uniref:Anaphase-promoting complex subunit 4 WD40 domain-containing protein n=1 Tax=Exophiala mesophila TaxID=212818 RepID=A0A0D1WXL9_EXOME|nr:uncharacterized protein PV10_01953 [Exophiala mesophila]KIV94160.1 hypothetical protein PV10_01953 [Exophiala mesophila]
MDVHRCRFVPYPSRPINTLAFSHPSDVSRDTPTDLRLALGRNNGDLEIWNPLGGAWLQEVVFKGAKDTTIEQVAWTQDILAYTHDSASPFDKGNLRLFSTGGSDSITEWDLASGTPRRLVHTDSQDIWCFAAQPQISHAEAGDDLDAGAGSQLLAAGCGNGSVILFSTADDDLRYLRSLPTPASSKAKVLSVTWRDRKTIVAGYDDSTIRVFDVPTRSIVRNMSLGKPVEGNETVAWALKCLPDGTILSGDSTGELKIWNSKNYSLSQRLKTHQADILDISASSKGDMIFTVGVDRRTVAYMPTGNITGTKFQRWAELSHKRYHNHDVKCSASFESKDLSILVSGGIDGVPVVTPIRRYQSENHISLTHLPQKPQLSTSTSSRVFVAWWDREITVYHLPAHSPSVNTALPRNPTYQVMTRLSLQHKEALEDVQISERGDILVAATANRLKLFQLRKAFAAGRPTIRTKQIELPSLIGKLGGRQAAVSPDGRWLFVIRRDNTINLVKIVYPKDPKQPPILHENITKLYRSARPRNQTCLASHAETITQVAFSSDGRILAIGCLDGSIDTWVLEGHEDTSPIPSNGTSSGRPSDSSSESSSDEDDDDDDDVAPVTHGQKWVRNTSGSSLPRLDSAIIVLTFRPSSMSTPHKASANGESNIGLHATRRNPHPVAHKLPNADVKLFALTATHQLFEFDVFTNSLSDWSRRNPPEYLPESLRKQTHRVVGCFWDTNDLVQRGERLWLYGHNYLVMVDVSRDFPQGSDTKFKSQDTSDLKSGQKGRLGPYDVLEPALNGTSTPTTRDYESIDAGENPLHSIYQPSPSKKRKRQHSTNGAGAEMKPSDRGDGMGSGMRKFTSTGEHAEIINIDNPGHENRDSEASPVQIDNLVQLRRNGGDQKPHGGNDEDGIGGDPSGILSHTSHSARLQDQSSSPLSFYTHSYNSILGIGILGPQGSPILEQPVKNLTDDGSATRLLPTPGPRLEVVIVERSIWDMPHVPRFDGGDWGS